MSTHHGLLVHVVFSTKYRKPYLSDQWRDELFAYIGGVVQDHKSTLLKAGGIEDHVHLLIRIHPEFAISKTVQPLNKHSVIVAMRRNVIARDTHSREATTCNSPGRESRGKACAPRAKSRSDGMW